MSFPGVQYSCLWKILDDEDDEVDWKYVWSPLISALYLKRNLDILSEIGRNFSEKKGRRKIEKTNFIAKESNKLD